MAKLADAPDLGSGGAILRGSSPLPGTSPDPNNTFFSLDTPCAPHLIIPADETSVCAESGDRGRIAGHRGRFRLPDLLEFVAAWMGDFVGVDGTGRERLAA